MTLKFNEKTHRYWLDGKPVKSVTGVIGGGIPKPFLMAWAKKFIAEWCSENRDELRGLLDTLPHDDLVNFLKGLPDQRRDEAGVRGTAVHDILEALFKGETAEVDPELVPLVQGVIDLTQKIGLQPIFTETRLFSREPRYAGTADMIAQIGGETWLLDWKTSRGVYGETALQTAAYAMAEYLAPDEDTVLDMPKITRTGVVHVTAEGAFLYPLATSRFEIGEHYRAFKQAYAMNDLKNEIPSFLKKEDVISSE